MNIIGCPFFVRVYRFLTTFHKFSVSLHLLTWNNEKPGYSRDFFFSYRNNNCSHPNLPKPNCIVHMSVIVFIVRSIHMQH